MPIRTAVDIMWLQPGVTVGWRWHCREPATVAATPPPLYFWFIPLADARDRKALAVSAGQTERDDEPDGNWVFAWRIGNRGPRELPLKINIWTPIGATPCASMS